MERECWTLKNEILDLINDLEKGFENNGYYRLKAEIRKKKNKYFDKGNDFINEGEKITLLKQTFTDILLMLYRHAIAGIDIALNRVRMIDSIEDFFKKEMNYNNKLVIINKEGRGDELSEIRSKYEGFIGVKRYLIYLIQIANDKQYITYNKEIEKIIKEDKNERHD